MRKIPQVSQIMNVDGLLGQTCSHACMEALDQSRAPVGYSVTVVMMFNSAISFQSFIVVNRYFWQNVTSDA